MRATIQLKKSICLLPLLVVVSTSAPAQEKPTRGVIVETLTQNFVADRVGLREGDLIQTWERGDARGEIVSPFDLMEIEMEQAPLGTVTMGAKETNSSSIGPWSLASGGAIETNPLWTFAESLR